MSAAIGLVQLERLPEFLARRQEIVNVYDAAFSSLDRIMQRVSRSSGSVPTFYWIQLNDAVLRDSLAKHLLDLGIYTNFRYWPLHMTSMYKSAVRYPGADSAAASTLLLPLHQGLSDADVEQVVAGVSRFLIKAL